MTSAVDTPTAAAAPTAAVVPAEATTPPAEGSPPKFFGAPRETVALPKAGALDWNTGFETGLAAGATYAALRLLASSSPCCFFAKACLSLQVNFFAPPGDGELGEGVDADCCSKAENGFLSFLGVGRDTGVYALFVGSILSCSSGFEGAVDDTAAAVVIRGGGEGCEAVNAGETRGGGVETEAGEAGCYLQN